MTFRIHFPTLLLLTLLTLSGTPGFAQGRGHDVDREARIEQIAEHLDLTDVQRAEIEPILMEHHAAVQAIKDDARGLRDQVQSGDLTREEAQAQRGEFETRIQEERAAFAQAVQPVLTPEQQTKLAEMQAKRERRRGDRPRRGPRGG